MLFRRGLSLYAAVRSGSSSVKWINFDQVIRHNSSVPSAMSDKFALPRRYGSGEKSVWVEYIQLNAEYKPAVNLGQGFPDYHAPEHVTKALSEIPTSDNPLLNQYTRGFGHPRLVQNLAKVYSPLVGRELDPFNEILVTSGAYEALFSAILGYVEEGDEVIVIEPFFDCYDYMIKSAGGIPKFIALEPKAKGANITSADWVLDEKELASMFNSKTKMIILNTPHNPLGKVFTQKELEVIADLCKKHDVLCLSDEVYEWMVYEPVKHIRIVVVATAALATCAQVEDPCKTKSRVVPDDKYCDKYWECDNGQSIQYDCPNGLVFAGKHRGVTEGCDYPWRSNYCEYPKVQTNPPIGTEHCDWLYGIFGHETSCTRYWTCWNGTATEQLCIGGLLYNENAHSCDWPENVDGCQKHPLCNEDPNGNVPLGKSCNRYWQCQGGYPRLQRCPAMLVFDRRSLRCVVPPTEECDVPTTTAPPPEEDQQDLRQGQQQPQKRPGNEYQEQQGRQRTRN